MPPYRSSCEPNVGPTPPRLFWEGPLFEVHEARKSRTERGVEQVGGGAVGFPLGDAVGLLVGAFVGAFDGAGVDPQQAHSFLLLFTTRAQSGVLVDACGTEHCPSVGLMFGEADEDL